MALFETSAERRAPPDDTARLRCTVKHAHTIDRHTEYTISVQAGPRKENAWSVERRYRDFASLHAELQAADIPLPLPPKRLLGNMQPAFVAERQLALQNYLNEVLKHPILALSLPVRKFLDPKNYSLSLHELALQSVSVALRGDGGYELRGALPDIGWRIRKRYFLVSSDGGQKPNCLLAWQQRGPDCCLSDKDLGTALKCLQGMSHPYIDRIHLLHGLEAGAYAVRSAHPAGTLRDALYGAEYGRCHLAKYGRPAARRPVEAARAVQYGRQMLEALAFLHERGLPYGHLHPGNVVISNQKVLLLDIENGLLGAPSLYRPYVLENKGINSLEAVDVYCFGHTVYEMLCAEPLGQASCDSFPKEISEEVESMLRLCLSSAACRRGVPSAATLLHHPLFARANGLAGGAVPHLKFPLALKERLREAAAAVEGRLAEEQKLVRSERRAARVQEIVGSEREVRRRRRRARRDDEPWRSASSLAEPASAASTPTPPRMPDACHDFAPATPSSGPAPSPPPAAPPAPRTALLSAICSFDRANLQRVDAR